MNAHNPFDACTYQKSVIYTVVFFFVQGRLYKSPASVGLTQACPNKDHLLYILGPVLWSTLRLLTFGGEGKVTDDPS